MERRRCASERGGEEKKNSAALDDMCSLVDGRMEKTIGTASVRSRQAAGRQQASIAA